MPNFNTFRFNEGLYNGGTSFATIYSDDLVFDGHSISDGVTYLVHGIDESGPKRELIGESRPNADGVNLTDDQWREKLVTVHGTVRVSDPDDMRGAMDDLRK